MRFILVISLLHLLLSLSAQTSSSTKVIESKCEVNLELYNGQNGVISTTRGAVTVANKNDTDGDEEIDNEDFTVQALNSLGRDEVDLMKLVIKKNTTVDPISLLIKRTGGNFRLWRKPNKSDSFTLNSNGEAYLVDLPFNGGTEAVLYVEAPEVSASKDDIKIQLLRNTPTGPVVCDDEKATAVWFVDKIVELQNSDTPVPGQAGALNDLNDSNLIGRIENTYRFVSGQRWGHGYFNKGAIDGDNSVTNKRLGGRIVMEFSMLPSDLGDATKIVKMDITRQKAVRTHSYEYGALSVIDRPNSTSNMMDNENQIKFPEDDNMDNEKANDDGNNGDEDNELKNMHIYSIDVPSLLKKPWITDGVGFSTLPYFGRRMNFKEFVRVVPYGSIVQPYGNEVRGSRASDKILWTCSVYAKLDASDRYVFDTENTTNSAPVRVVGNPSSDGNGTVSISLGTTVPDNSFRVWVSGTGSTRKLNLKDAINSVTTNANFPSGGSASVTFGGVTCTITDGSTPFNAMNLWKFNTFTTTQAFKNNTITSGQNNLDINP